MPAIEPPLLPTLVGGNISATHRHHNHDGPPQAQGNRRFASLEHDLEATSGTPSGLRRAVSLVDADWTLYGGNPFVRLVGGVGALRCSTAAAMARDAMR